MKKICRFALAAAALSTPLAAAPVVTGEAVIQWRHDAKDKVIVGQTIWNCYGTKCRGRLVDHGPTLQRACRQLARQGEVQSFRTPSRSFGEQELSRCNR